MILERLIDAMSHGPQSYHAWALLIMQTIFEAPGLNLGRDCQLLADPQLTFPVAALLETERGHQALQVRLQGPCICRSLCAPLQPFGVCPSDTALHSSLQQVWQST